MGFYDKQASLFWSNLVLLILSTIFIALRCLARLSIRGFGWDDYLMVGGYVTYFGSCIAMFYANFAAIGVPDAFLTPKKTQTGLHAYIAWEPLYVVTLILVKASICFTLLRIVDRKRYVYIIYATLALSTASGLVTFIAVLNFCHPLSTAWDPQPGGTCQSNEYIKSLAYFISATAIVTDFTCAVLPIFILWKVQMQRSLKYTVVCILGLGFLASSATLVRLRYLDDYSRKVEYFYNVADIATWSMVECGLGICAGSASTLKPLFRRMLKVSGSSNDGATRTTNPPGRYGLQELNATGNSKHFTSKITTTRKASDEEDSESQKDMITNNGIMINTEVELEEEYESLGSPRKTPLIHEEEV